MKKLFSILICFILVIPFLTGCDTVIFGKFCDVEIMTSYEANNINVFYTENASLFVVYNKNTNQCYELRKENKYHHLLDEVFKVEEFDDYFIVKSSSKTLEETIHVNFYGEVLSIDTIELESGNCGCEEEEYGYSLYDGFYSSFQRVDPDEEELNEEESLIWNYCKEKSIKEEFPYMIEGKLHSHSSFRSFNVNVYNKMMWKGSALVNQGIISSSIYTYDPINKVFDEIIKIDKGAIKDYKIHLPYVLNNINLDVIYYSKKDNYIHKMSIENKDIKKDIKLVNNQNMHIYYVDYNSNNVIDYNLNVLNNPYSLKVA